MALFYAPDIEQTPILPEEDSQHAIKVLRMTEGDKLDIIDGKGNLFHAEIIVANHKKCVVKTFDKIENFNIRTFNLHIAIAPTKNIDRLEWFVEKATEIGIEEITPVICRFSERKIVKNDRIEKILVSAMKQSKKAFLPKLNEQCTFEDFIKKEKNGQLFIAHCYEKDKKLLSKSYIPGNNATILIGPEGDFSEEEVEMAIKNSYIPVSLGNSRLRTETAGVVACHTVDLINELKTI